MTTTTLDLRYCPAELLPCLALRHRWLAHSALARTENVSGARVWDWELRCTGCDSSATELRDDYDVRLPGTQRQYQLTDEYRKFTGYTQAEYLHEIRRRGLFHTLRVA